MRTFLKFLSRFPQAVPTSQVSMSVPHLPSRPLDALHHLDAPIKVHFRFLSINQRVQIINSFSKHLSCLGTFCSSCPSSHLFLMYSLFFLHHSQNLSPSHTYFMSFYSSAQTTTPALAIFPSLFALYLCLHLILHTPPLLKGILTVMLSKLTIKGIQKTRSLIHQRVIGPPGCCIFHSTLGLSVSVQQQSKHKIMK